MAYSAEERRKLLASNAPEAEALRKKLTDYLARTQLTMGDFAKRIGYSNTTLWYFCERKYEHIASDDSRLRTAIARFMEAHPVAPVTISGGKLYETSNVKLLRRYFQEALEQNRAIYVHGDPGSQKSFVLEHLVAALNRDELPKNGIGKRAYYVYCPVNVRPNQLLKEIAAAAGVSGQGDNRKIIRNLRFEFQARRVIVVLDEAQHLSVECLEAVRELLDRPPYFGLLFAGSHQLQTAFIKNALELEQWNSRFKFGDPLPGIAEDEARNIITEELGTVPKNKVETLVKQSRARSLRQAGEHEYISARRLFWAIEDIKRDPRFAGKGAES